MWNLLTLSEISGTLEREGLCHQWEFSSIFIPCSWIELIRWKCLGHIEGQESFKMWWDHLFKSVWNRSECWSGILDQLFFSILTNFGVDTHQISDLRLGSAGIEPHCKSKSKYLCWLPMYLICTHDIVHFVFVLYLYVLKASILCRQIWLITCKLTAMPSNVCFCIHCWSFYYIIIEIDWQYFFVCFICIYTWMLFTSF